MLCILRYGALFTEWIIRFSLSSECEQIGLVLRSSLKWTETANVSGAYLFEQMPSGLIKIVPTT